MIKQIAKLKEIKFYEKLGTIYDKTQRLRKLSGVLADELNLNKEKVEIAASISKSVHTTLAPSLAKTIAVALPIPLPAPVMRMVLF